MLKMQRPRHWKLIVPFVPVPIFDGIRFISWVAGVAVGPLIVIKEQVADNECVLVHQICAQGTAGLSRRFMTD